MKSNLPSLPGSYEWWRSAAESFLMPLAALMQPGTTEKLSRGEIAAWFRCGLVVGTDPSSPGTWGPTANHHQHTVEMTALTLALQMARGPFGNH